MGEGGGGGEEPEVAVRSDLVELRLVSSMRSARTCGMGTALGGGGVGMGGEISWISPIDGDVGMVGDLRNIFRRPPDALRRFLRLRSAVVVVEDVCEPAGEPGVTYD